MALLAALVLVLAETRGAGGATNAPAIALERPRRRAARRRRGRPALPRRPRLPLARGQASPRPAASRPTARSAGGRGRRWRRRTSSSRAWPSRARQVQPDFKYTRVLNGFSALLDPRTVALLERAQEVVGVYPVRAAFPATVSGRVLSAPHVRPGSGHAARRRRAPRPRRPRRDDRAPRHGRRRGPAVPRAAGSCAGSTSSAASENALPGPKPDGSGELERHGTELAGILVGAGGPSGLAGVAPGASVLPDPRRGLAAGRARGVGRVRAHRPAPRRARARGRPERRRRRARRRPHRPRRRGRAVRRLRRRPRGARRGGRAQARHARRRAGRERRARRARVRQRRRSRRRAGGADRRRRGRPRAGAARPARRARRARRRSSTGSCPLAGAVPPADAVSPRRRAPRLLSPGAPAAEQAAALELADFFDAPRLQPRRRAAPRSSPPARTRPASVARRGAGRSRRGARPRRAAPVRRARPRRAGAGPGRRVCRTRSRSSSLRSARRGTERRRLARRRARSEALPPGQRVAALLVARARLRRAREARARRRRASPSRRASPARTPTARPATARSTARARRPPSSPAPRPCSRRRARSSRASALKSVARRHARGRRRTSRSARRAPACSTSAPRPRPSSPRRRRRSRSAGRTGRTGARGGRCGVRQPLLAAADDDARRRAPRVPGRGHDRDGAAAAGCSSRPARRPASASRRSCPRPPAAALPAEGAIVLAPARRPGRPRPVRRRLRPAGGRRSLGGLELSQRRFAPSETQPAVLSLRAGRVRTVGGSDEVHPVARLDLELSTERRPLIGVIAPPPRRAAGPLRVRPDRPRPRRPGARRGPLPRSRVTAFPSGGGRADAQVRPVRDPCSSR